MKASSVMDSLFTPKALKGQQISASGFDGRSVSESPAKGGFAQSFKSLEPSSSDAPKQGSGDTDSLNRLVQRLKDWANNQSGTGETATGNVDPSKSPSLDSLSTVNPDTESSEKSVFESLGLSQTISSNMSGEEILKTLADIAVKTHEKQTNLPEMNLEQIQEAIEAGVVSIEQLKSMQKSLSQKGVEASVMDLQRVLTASGYERSTQGGQTVFVKPEGSQSTHLQEQASQVAGKASLPDFGLALKDSKLSTSKGMESASFSQLLQTSPAPVSEGSGLRLDAALNTQRQNAVSEWAPVVVNKNTTEWNKELVSALGDRLKMQVGQGVKEATVRLDPPELGRVDFSVRIDGDRVQVNINSTNVQVREMLAQQIDRLRGDLASDNSGSSVDVNIGDGKSKDQNQEHQFADKNNVNTVLPFDNTVESTADIPNKKNNLGLNTKA